MMEALFAGLFGLLIGSFLNVCIYRLPRDLSVVHPRSHCPNCEKLVAWYDNMPVLSWMLLRAKCRNCKTPIHWQYPVVELATGILFFWSVYTAGWTALGLKYCLFSAIMVDLVATDWNDRILPDEFTLGGFVAGLLIAPFTPAPSSLMSLFLPVGIPQWIPSVAEAAAGGLLCAGLLYLTGKIYEKVRHREGLGFGDVKMLLTIGAFLGLPGALMTIFIGSIFGAVIGSIYIWKAGEDMTYELPYGSFLGAAALFVGLFGEYVSAWYWKLFT